MYGNGLAALSAKPHAIRSAAPGDRHQRQRHGPGDLHATGQYTGQRGDRWINGGYLSTAYNHFTTPNSATPDCLNTSNNYGLKTARSRHTGGVNVLFCDGSLHFISNNVTLTTWQALATRMGGEVLGDY